MVGEGGALGASVRTVRLDSLVQRLSATKFVVVPISPSSFRQLGRGSYRP